jgi:hypothetical protein
VSSVGEPRAARTSSREERWTDAGAADPLEVAIASRWFDEFADIVDDLLEARSTPLQRAALAWGTAAVHSA